MPSLRTVRTSGWGVSGGSGGQRSHAAPRPTDRRGACGCGWARALAPLAPLPQQAVLDGSARIAVGAFPTAGDAEPAWDHCGAGTAVRQGIARPPARNRAFGAAGGVIEMENAQEIQRAEPGATLPGRCDGIWQGSDRLCPRHGPVYPAVIW